MFQLPSRLQTHLPSPSRDLRLALVHYPLLPFLRACSMAVPGTFASSQSFAVAQDVSHQINNAQILTSMYETHQVGARQTS
jgi:hypothetical protein